MLTTTTRPATTDERRTQEIAHREWSPPSTFESYVNVTVGVSVWVYLVEIFVLGVGGAVALYPKNPKGQVLFFLACVALLWFARIFWKRRVQPSLSRPPRDRLHPTASAPTTVDQWLCIAYKYYSWRVTGDLPTLLALTREGDLLLVQTQALDEWTRSDEPGPLKLGSMCRYETIQDGPISLAFEGTPVPVEELHEHHPAAGVMSLDPSLIRVPRRTYEALARTNANRT